MDSLPRLNVLLMVLPASNLEPVLHIQSKLDVQKEQTDYVSMISQSDRLLEPRPVE